MAKFSICRWIFSLQFFLENDRDLSRSKQNNYYWKVKAMKLIHISFHTLYLFWIQQFYVYKNRVETWLSGIRLTKMQIKWKVKTLYMYLQNTAKITVPQHSKVWDHRQYILWRPMLFSCLCIHIFFKVEKLTVIVENIQL